MGGLLRILVALTLMVVGGLLAWPQIRGWVLLQRAPARVIDVVTTPVSPGQVRVSVAYEFPLPSSSSMAEIRAIAWRAGDPSFRAQPDPVVSMARAAEITADLMDRDGGRHRTAFYLPQDPEGTVILPDGAASGPRNRLQVGVVVIAIGIALFLVRPRAPSW